jgi:mediator of RNA polymerase II transcription subunit 13
VTIYASFISAVAGAISVQLIRHHNAIPLGARTFFTAVDRNFYDSPRIENDDLDSYPALTTLRVELSQVGKVIISLHTVYQNGISRLYVPTADVADLRPNLDLWLAPNGTVARLTNLNADQSTAFTPKQAKNEATSRQVAETRQLSWKETVLGWIGTAGLPVFSVEEEHWVEVEVSEPLYARLAADYLRQSDFGQSNSPLKRILWPSRYCFRRAKPTPMAVIEGIDGITKENDDPLYFAEDWLNGAASRNDKHTSQNSTLSQAVQSKDVITPKVEIPDTLESLARAAQYPDLQAASLVYPTPPDGALAAGLVHLSSDPFGTDGSDLGMSQTPAERSLARQEELRLRKRQSAPDSGTGLGPPNVLGVGSGLYDAHDYDEDLFGAMNDRDFGAKGITDADFSFFDDQDFDDFEDEKPKSDIQESEQNPTTVTSFAPPALEETPVEKASEDQGRNATLAEPGSKDEVESRPNLNVDTKMETPLQIHDTTPDGQIPIPSRQTMSPPLSPVEVKKILSTKSHQSGPAASTEISELDGHDRRQSNYDPISFERDITVSDRKYGAAGRFFFSRKTDAPVVSTQVPPIPTVGFPRGRKQRTGLQAENEGFDPHRSTPTHMNKYRLRSDSVSSDDTSYSSSDDYSERGASPSRVTGVKRKRPLSEDDKSTTSSLERLSLASEVDKTTSKEDNSVFLGNFFSVFIDWSLVGYFSLRQNQSSPLLVRNEDQVQLAQLIVDQLTQSSLRHPVDGCISLPDPEQDTVSLRTFLQDTTIMGDVERLDLRAYLSLQDSLAGASETGAARQSVQRKDVMGSLSKLPPPQLRIHRGRDFLELLPPAVSFWETFGFEPASGPKNISAYCICPQTAKEGADAFLKRLENLYSTCNFGKHVRGDKSKSFENGIGLWNVSAGDTGYNATMQSLRTICEGLGMTSTIRSLCSWLIVYRHCVDKSSIRQGQFRRICDQSFHPCSGFGGYLFGILAAFPQIRRRCRQNPSQPSTE